MAQVNDSDILKKIVGTDIDVRSALNSLVDRESGEFRLPEGPLLDFKLKLDCSDKQCLSEISRDVLAFSNSDGGVLLIGVGDDKRIVGHPIIDSKTIRNGLAHFIGTRVDLEVSKIQCSIRGETRTIPYILVRRSSLPYPNLLRSDIDTPRVIRKVKYAKGSLFYRQESEVLVEPPGEYLEERALDLAFTGASPRTRSSFLIIEDRPGLRLYSQINDRFFGRESETEDILSTFSDPRGKGISLAGLGGVGKTELAIKAVGELYKRGIFRQIYSGSAKQSLLGPAGPQQADAVFMDLPSFLRDLASWLGVEIGTDANIEENKKICLKELDSKTKILLFVDNLETIEDARFFEFLDKDLPKNCWLLVTTRIHKIRNMISFREIGSLKIEPAVRLLRHELKRQGLDELASSELDTIKQKVDGLYLHPLAIRWYAWTCKKDNVNWQAVPKQLEMAEIESFCVGHTLDKVSAEIRKTLCAIAAAQGQVDVTPNCLTYLTGFENAQLDDALVQLESAGLVTATISELNGISSYSIAAISERPVRELMRNNDWEKDFAKNLKRYTSSLGNQPPEDAAIRELLDYNPSKIKALSPEQMATLRARVRRVRTRCPEKWSVILVSLEAECERHSNNLISADKIYEECAEKLMDGQLDKSSERHLKILLEAATVAKWSTTVPQARRVIRYLEALKDTDMSPLRVYGMLAENYAVVGDKTGFDLSQKYLQDLLNEDEALYSPKSVSDAKRALGRAKETMSRSSGKRL